MRFSDPCLDGLEWECRRRKVRTLSGDHPLHPAPVQCPCTNYIHACNTAFPSRSSLPCSPTLISRPSTSPTTRTSFACTSSTTRLKYRASRNSYGKGVSEISTTTRWTIRVYFLRYLLDTGKTAYIPLSSSFQSGSGMHSRRLGDENFEVGNRSDTRPRHTRARPDLLFESGAPSAAKRVF